MECGVEFGMGVSIVFWILVGVDVVNWGSLMLAPLNRGGLCTYVENHIHFGFDNLVYSC